jgi:hypothetical protein
MPHGGAEAIHHGAEEAFKLVDPDDVEVVDVVVVVVVVVVGRGGMVRAGWTEAGSAGRIRCSTSTAMRSVDRSVPRCGLPSSRTTATIRRCVEGLGRSDGGIGASVSELCVYVYIRYNAQRLKTGPGRVGFQ